MKTLGLYALYFLGLPGIVLFFTLRYRSQKKFLEFYDGLEGEIGKEGGEKTQPILKRRRILIISTLVLLLIFLLSWHWITSELADQRMKFEIASGPAGIYLDNPISVSLGPTYETEKLVEEIRKNESRWLPALVEDLVELKELSRGRGRVAAYRTYDGRLIIVKTYLLPYPYVKSYGLQFVETETGEKVIIKKEEKTIFYPLDPGTVGSTAKL